ncbi:hypothetical protein [Rhodoplanes roseus]|uniref:Uncharacterized protein n=1 Tax=Rhodoplanes roseus TaxID=29409 RepID=A0A327L674_9BRAD|nr:hypothetical protein [Rhodoplanes roseus]RAI45393.1 hypothetical protein CH341_04355 [Rhodoplanes roseus]
MRYHSQRISRLARLLFVVLAAVAAMDGYVGLRFGWADEPGLRRSLPGGTSRVLAVATTTVSEPDDEWSDAPAGPLRWSYVETGGGDERPMLRSAALPRMGEPDGRTVRITRPPARGPPARSADLVRRTSSSFI